MAVLITGAAGFLAGPLYDELRPRRPREPIFRASRSPRPGMLAGELTDRAAVARLLRRCRPRWVFHLAGTTRRLGWEGLWRAHVTTTLNLIEAAAALPRGRRPALIVCGSSGEYGPPPGRGLVTEEAPTRPVTLYGASKLAQTLAALSARHRGMDVYVARIFNVLGPGIPEHLAPGAFARQIALAERGLAPRVIRVGDLSPRRDYVDVRDVARALADLPSRARPGEIYNVCLGRAVPMSDILKGLLALSCVLFQVRLDRSRLRGSEVPRIAGDHARITRTTGWHPRIPLARSLRDTLEHHRLAAR
jgi:GDP-4-dehydro-6-deoxy-D-mannose reductase